MCYGNRGIQVVQNGYFEIVVLENSSQVFDSDPYESPRPWPPLQVPVTYYRGDFPARRLPSNALKIVYYFATSVLLHHKTYNRGDFPARRLPSKCAKNSLLFYDWCASYHIFMTFATCELYNNITEGKTAVHCLTKKFPR